MHCLVDDALLELKGLEISSHPALPYLATPPQSSLCSQKSHTQKQIQQDLPGRLSGAYHVGAGLQHEA